MCHLILGTGTYANILHIHPTFMAKEASNNLTITANDADEVQFQEYLDNLFDTEGKTIDTNGWCTHRINCARFDYRLLTDTLNIPLVDSSQNRFFTYPLKNYVTSPFGPRRQFWHFGTDIKVVYRDTLRCAFDGIVRIVTNDRYGYGKVVVVRHHYGLETLYSHMAATLVKNKQVLKSGDVIGLGGRTGRATGNHLHFEIRFCGEPFDPAHILDYENYTLKNTTFALSRSTFEYISDIRKTMIHTVRSGDNLGRIARHYGTTINKICRLNGITSKTMLRIGRKIIVRKNESAELISHTATASGKES
jgi:hypothetical protein